jgi:HK97 family phage prohead protease
MSALTTSNTNRLFRFALAPIRDLQVRDATGTGDGSWTIEGYAAVYEQETVLWDGRWFRMREEIARDAFTNGAEMGRSVMERIDSGEERVHLNYVHEMASAVAATDVTGVGALELQSDFHGLRFFARVDPDDPDAQRMAVKMRRGVVRQASFAFTIAREELVEETVSDRGQMDEKWRILEIGHLFDVCVCAQGAYPQTESFLRSLAASYLGRADTASAGRDHRTDDRPASTSAGGAHIAPGPAGESESMPLFERERELAKGERMRLETSGVLRTHGVTIP